MFLVFLVGFPVALLTISIVWSFVEDCLIEGDRISCFVHREAQYLWVDLIGILFTALIFIVVWNAYVNA